MTNKNNIKLVPTTRKYYDMINKLESDLSKELSTYAGQTIELNITDKGFIDHCVTLVFEKKTSNGLMMTYDDCHESLEWITVKFDERDGCEYDDMSELFSSYIQLALTIVDELNNICK